MQYSLSGAMCASRSPVHLEYRGETAWPGQRGQIVKLKNFCGVDGT